MILHQRWRAEILNPHWVVYAGHNQYKTIMASELVEYTRISERWSAAHRLSPVSKLV